MPTTAAERLVEPPTEPELVVPLSAHKNDSLTSLSSLVSSSSSGSLNTGYQREVSVTSLSSDSTDDEGALPSGGSEEDEDSGLELVLSAQRRQRREPSLPTKADVQFEAEAALDRLPTLSEEGTQAGLPVTDSWPELEEERLHRRSAHTEVSAAPSAEKQEREQEQQEKRVIVSQERFEEAPARVQFFVNLSLNVLKAVGHLKEYLWSPNTVEEGREGYTPLFRTDDFGGFHARNIFRRWQDCFCNPIDSAATNMVSLMERRFEQPLSSRFTLTGESRQYINLGSYNYLGFGGLGPCAEHAEVATSRYGVASATVRQEVGTQRLHTQLEELVAEFLGTEAAITFGMGFATNSTNLPSLVGPDCLVISDQNNHASIILGLRLSGAKIRVFKHNDMDDLEKQLLKAVTEPDRRWRKILVVVEGVYSMEGSLVLLPDVIRLKKKYGAYLYLDEAHSIGAVGATGRGVVEYYGCSPRDVDIMMGTFTKSFGAAGGYIGGSRALIDHLKVASHSDAYAITMPPCVVQQVISSMRIIMGRDGTDTGRRKIETLARNSHYFRQRLRQLGFIVYGNDDSPVVPLLSLFVSKTAALYRRLKEHGVATAVIAYPATPLTAARARFCLSASHTREQLDYVVSVVDKCGDELELKFSQQPVPPAQVVY